MEGSSAGSTLEANAMSSQNEQARTAGRARQWSFAAAAFEGMQIDVCSQLRSRRACVTYFARSGGVARCIDYIDFA
jgi:hypothetical protein